MLIISSVVQDQSTPVIPYEGRTPKIVVGKILPISPELPTYQEQPPQIERSFRQTTRKAASILLASPFALPLLREGYDRNGTRLLPILDGQNIDLEV